MGMPEAAHRGYEALAVPDVRTVRVAFHVGELVVLPMVRDPGNHVSLDGHPAEDGERVANTAIRLEVTGA